MRKRLALVLVVVLFGLLTATNVGAIRYGQRDGNAHPYVGLLYAFVNAEVGGYVCSGTLLSPTVFLTAAHCLPSDATQFLVSFAEQPLVTGFNWVTGTAYPHPNYAGLNVPATYDIGVVIFSQPVTLDTYGSLPTAGLLDQLSTQRGQQNVMFTAVGYGLQDSQNPNSRRRVEEWDIARYNGDQRLIQVESALNGGFNASFTNNPGIGGGTCSGDSGGPILWQGTNIVVAINSFGVAPFCRGNDYAFRTDTEVARAFLSQWLSLP